MDPLILEGDVDSENADRVLAELEGQVRRHADELGDDEPLVIDCTRLMFFSSAGLAMLVRLRSHTRRDVVLLQMPLRLRRSFVVTGLDEMFEFR